MAETFLNTRTTGVATSNVQANVDQANGQVQQPVQSNANGTAGVVPNTQNQTNQVNPITIPIQIQPQVASTGQQQNTNNIQPNQSLQVNPQQQSQTYNAPTPQTYQNTNTNNNVVDFNQIYQSYQNRMGQTNQNPNYGVSGIKKTSFNTTIVTPTTANLNTVQGQYQSAYADTVNGVISTMLTQIEQLRTGNFGYDPTKDSALRMASEYAANSTLQSLAGSGVLNSSATAERVARIVSELIPQYEQKAYDRQVQYLSQLADTAQLIMNYDSQQFEYWKDAKDREFKEKEFEYQKQQDALENAWKRVDELGFVDNKASAILGVRVGTLSGAAREAKEQREFELAKMREQAQIEYQNSKALYKLKADLDLQNSRSLAAYQNSLDIQKGKELAAYQSSLSKSETAYNYQLQQKYGTSKSSNSTTSLSTYKDIINNRFADYDEFSRKYTVSDNTSLYNYLVSEYSAGRMSSSDLANLTAMYNVTQPSSNSTSKAQRLSYLQSLEQYR